jgi:hypothetical protein
VVKNMRPRGDIRQALSRAAWSLATERPQGSTWRDLASKAQVGFAAARRTVCNMQRDGELQVVDTLRVPGAARPMNLYAPAQETRAAGDGTPALAGVLQAWCRSGA